MITPPTNENTSVETRHKATIKNNCIEGLLKIPESDVILNLNFEVQKLQW